MPRPRSGPNRRYSSYTRESKKLPSHASGCENVGKELPENCLSELCKTKRDENNMTTTTYTVTYLIPKTKKFSTIEVTSNLDPKSDWKEIHDDLVEKVNERVSIKIENLYKIEGGNFEEFDG